MMGIPVRGMRPGLIVTPEVEGMDFFELLAKGENTPVLCVDGAVGMLVEYPLGDAQERWPGSRFG